jgi:hypothetical protein
VTQDEHSTAGHEAHDLLVWQGVVHIDTRIAADERSPRTGVPTVSHNDQPVRWETVCELLEGRNQDIHTLQLIGVPHEEDVRVAVRMSRLTRPGR